MLDAEGWFDTGDLGQLLADGTLVLTGRAKDTIVLNDVTSAHTYAQGYLKRDLPGTYMKSGTSTGGWGSGAAFGAKIAAPDRKVVVVTGDGGFGHVWAELETLVREKIDLINTTQLPAGVSVVPIYDRTWLIGKTLTTVFGNLLEGALLVSFVLYSFLGNARAAFIVAVRVPWPNRPAPKPIISVPKPNTSAEAVLDDRSAEKITARNAGIPTSAPKLAIRNGSAPRLSTREARPKPSRPPTASAAVSLVVSPTDSFRIWPP